jgi:hypothetical protein
VFLDLSQSIKEEEPTWSAEQTSLSTMELQAKKVFNAMVSQLVDATYD